MSGGRWWLLLAATIGQHPLQLILLRSHTRVHQLTFDIANECVNTSVSRVIVDAVDGWRR
jgi:hypothetical protein